MGKSGHPSTLSRVRTPQTAMRAASQYARRILPLRPKLNLPSRAPLPFNSAQSPLILGDAKKANDLLAGQFHFSGQLLDVGPWTAPAPSRRFAGWLQEFDWMQDLVAGGQAAHHARARLYVDSWIETYGKGNDFVHEPARLARRLFNWLSLWSPTLSAPGMEESELGLGAKARVLEQRRVSILRQLTILRASLKSIPPGLTRLTAGCALALGGARMTEGKAQLLERGLDLLDRELPLQILPDGGHISRSPEMTALALGQLLTLDLILAARGVEGSKELSRAIDRLAPMVAFFRRASGELAPFHGGGESQKKTISALIKAAPGSPKPFGYGPHVGFQRIDAGGTVMLIDTGDAPPRPYDTQAHMAPLAIDLSTQEGSIITSCGFNAEQPQNWSRPIRAAAAHSTLVLDNRSPGRLLKSEWKRRVVGDAVQSIAGPVKATRKEQESGKWLESYHEGYLGAYGLSHRRRLFIPPEGDDVRGEDSLFSPMGFIPFRRDQVPFAIRFHIHPEVRVSLSQDKSSALLVVGGRVGWRFRTDGGQVVLEDSVYLAVGTMPVKTQQLVIYGEAFCDSDGETRSNRVRWSFRKLKPSEDRNRKAPVQTDIEATALPSSENESHSGEGTP
jgi:uncharacterized heparinase superfamily protein